MSDPFDTHTPGLESPATILAEVTPSDAVDLAQPSRALNVATSGQVQVTTTGGSTVTLFIAAGIGFPVRASKIWATGTTATGIVAML